MEFGDVAVGGYEGGYDVGDREEEAEVCKVVGRFGLRRLYEIRRAAQLCERSDVGVEVGQTASCSTGKGRPRWGRNIDGASV